jgi:hypothetical protein
MGDLDFNSKLARMGYTPFKIRSEKPNFYQLDDGAILKIYPVLNGLILKKGKTPEQAQVNLQTYGASFVPQSLRGKPNVERVSLEEAIRPENIEKMDLPFKIINNEHFNEYIVDNKWILSIKTTLSQVNRSKIRNNIGEPIYGFNTSPVVKFKPKNR